MSTPLCSAHHPNEPSCRLVSARVRPRTFSKSSDEKSGEGNLWPLPRRSLSPHTTVTWHIRHPRLVSSGAERKKEHAGDGASPESGERRREDCSAARIATTTSFVVPARPLPPPGLRLTYRGFSRAARSTATLNRPRPID